VQYGRQTLSDNAAAEHNGHPPGCVQKHEPGAFRLPGDLGSLDVPNGGMFWTRIHARAALHAGHQRLTLRDGFVRQRKRWARGLADYAGRAARAVDFDIEHARLVKDGLERAKRAEECALGSLFGEQWQRDHQAAKQHDKDSVLHHPHGASGSHVF